MARSVGRNRRRLRRLALATWSVVAAGLVVAGGLVSLAPAPSAAGAQTSRSEVSASLVEASIAKTADLSQFNAGNIISDAVFYDSATMTEAQIQSFLESKVSSCRSGYTCLKDYYVQTRSIAASAMCEAYSGGEMERASRVIYKVSKACGINAQVLIVMLQKEQGLVTSTAPSSWAYQAAMGQGCPDTAGCDTYYYGFFNQMYGAARQLKIYTVYPTSFNYQAGRTNTIYWHPNASCGTSQVYIENQATANLYIYTPYRPNAAALAAGYGTGDGCSSYGNRNFYNYFTDWFGSTQKRSGETAIGLKYAQSGGASGWLGQATSAVHCGLKDAGCYQDFQNGKIHWSEATGAHWTRGGIQAAWAATQWENGLIGYPTSDEHCGLVDGGCYQDFQDGKIYWKASPGARVVLPKMLSGWSSVGYERSWLGYPVGDQVCNDAVTECRQAFESGVVQWTAASGSRATIAPIADAWLGLGAEKSKLGSPTSNGQCGLPGGGCYQEFRGGKIHWSNDSGAYPTWGGIQAAWARTRYERGVLGYPTGFETCGLSDGGCSQTFQNGTMYWSARTDAQFVLRGMDEGYVALGGPASKIGYPLLSEGCGLPEGGCYQVYQGGLMHWSPSTGAHATLGGIGAAWARSGFERGVLGYPISEEQCGLTAGGCYQDFKNGTIYWSAQTDARIVRSELADAYASLGGPDGELGYPTADSVCTGSPVVCTQKFQFGLIPAS